MPLPHPTTSPHASRPALSATTSHNAQPPAAGSQSRVKRLSLATSVAGPGLVNLPVPIGPPPSRQRVVRPAKSMPSLRSAAAAAAASLAAGPVPLLPRDDAFTPADILDDDVSSSNEIEGGQMLSPTKKIFAKEIFLHQHEREFPHLHGGSDEGGALPSRRQSLVLPAAKTDASSLLATSLPPPVTTAANQVTPSSPREEAATRRMPRPLSLVALQPSGGLFAASMGEAAVILLDHEQLQQPQDLCRTTERTGERIVDPREGSRTSLIESVSEDGSSECDFLFSWERDAVPAVVCHAQPLPRPPFFGPTLLMTPPPVSDVRLPSPSAFVTPPLPSRAGDEGCSLPPTPVSVFSSPSTPPAIASSPSSGASPSRSTLRRASAAHARKSSISYHHSGAADSPRTDSHAALPSSMGSPPRSLSTKPVARRQPSISYRSPMSSPLGATENKEEGQGQVEDVAELEEQTMKKSLSEGVVGLGLRGRYIWDGGMEPAPASPPPPTPTSLTFSIEQQQQQQPASRSSWRTWFGGASSSTPYLVSPTSSSFPAPPSLSAAHASDDPYGAWTDPGDHLERGEGGRRPSQSGSTISTLAGSLVRGWRPWITSPRPSSPTNVTTAPVAALPYSTSDSSFGNAPGENIWHPAAVPSSPLLPPPSPNNSGYPFPIPSSAGSTSTFGGPLRLPPPAVIASAPSNNRERRGSVPSSLTPSQDDEPVERSYHSTVIAPPPRGLRPLVLAPPPAIARLQQPLKSLGASARLTLLPIIKGSPSKIELEEGRGGAAEDNEEEQEGTRPETSSSPTKQQPPAVEPHCQSALLGGVSALVVSNQQPLQLHATFVDPPAEAFADRLRSHRRSGSVLKHRVRGSVLGDGQPAFGSTALTSADEQLQRRKASRVLNEKTYSTSISHHPATSTDAFHVEHFAHSHGSPSTISTSSSLQPTTLAPTTPTLTFNDESTTTRRSDDSFSRDQQPDPTTASVTQRPLSLYETLEQFVSSPLVWLEALLPAQLIFFLGFLLGPWCWVIGGWGLSTDGRVLLTKLQGAQLPSAFLGRAALNRLSSADSSPELRWRPTSFRQAHPPTMTSWSPSTSVDANSKFQQPFIRGRGSHPRPNEKGKGSRWALPALRSDNPNRWVWRNRIAAMLSGAVVIPGMTLAVIFAAI